MGSESTGPLVCRGCCGTFATTKGLKSHLRKRVPCDTSARSCEKCGEGFSTVEEVTKHMMSQKSCVPKVDVPKTCHCGRTFKRNADYLKHQRMQKTPCRSSYDCPCGKSFDTKVKLFWHCDTCVHDYDDIKLTWIML